MAARYLQAFVAYHVEVYSKKRQSWYRLVDTEEMCPLKAKQQFDGWSRDYPLITLRLVEVPSNRVVGFHEPKL
jgi:hypothetical protein